MDVFESASIIGREGGELVLRKSGEGGYHVEYRIEAATGGLLRQLLFKDETVVSEDIQREFVTYPSGVTIPQVAIRCTYRNGTLFSIRVFLINEAEFNSETSAFDFHVPLESGDVVVDRRDPKSKIVARVEQPIPDVLDFSPFHNSQTADDPEFGIGFRWWFILTNVVALLVILLGVGQALDEQQMCVE